MCIIRKQNGHFILFVLEDCDLFIYLSFYFTFYLIFIVDTITDVPIPPSFEHLTQHPTLLPSSSPHTVVCLWVTCVWPLANPFTFFLPVPPLPSALTAVSLFHVSMPNRKDILKERNKLESMNLHVNFTKNQKYRINYKQNIDHFCCL